MIITIIAVLLLGMVLGLYISTKIENRINRTMLKKHKIDTKNQDSNQVFKEMGVVKKWSYKYTDKNGNTIDTTSIYNQKHNEIAEEIKEIRENPPKSWANDEEERSECCGAKMDTDQRLCYECKDHC